MPSINQIVVWIIIGLLGGSLAGLIITRERKGFGILRNLGVGLIGALVGGLVCSGSSPASTRLQFRCEMSLRRSSDHCLSSQ